MMLFLIILIPLMTMRLWSEEKRQRTDQLLLTAPVSTTGVAVSYTHLDVYKRQAWNG